MAHLSARLTPHGRLLLCQRIECDGRKGAEAAVKVLQNGWAYRRPYDSTAERIAALPSFLRYYDGYRPHGGLDGDTPLGRLTRSTTS